MASGDGSRHSSSNSSAPQTIFDLAKSPENIFKNDGSFLEMFKKVQKSGEAAANASAKMERPAAGTPKVDAEKESDDTPKKTKDIPKPKYGFVGKRRGGKILPTGKVKKVKQDEEDDGGKKDAWSQYLSEVQKYKDQTCQEEGATRPLVK